MEVLQPLQFNRLALEGHGLTDPPGNQRPPDMALLFGGKPTPLLDGLLPDHDETLAEERSRDNRNCFRT
jgi:hypothetical protein